MLSSIKKAGTCLYISVFTELAAYLFCDKLSFEAKGQTGTRSCKDSWGFGQAEPIILIVGDKAALPQCPLPTFPQDEKVGQGHQPEHQQQNSRSLTLGWAKLLAVTVCLLSLLRDGLPTHLLRWTNAWPQAVCWTPWRRLSETSHAHSLSCLTLSVFSLALS